ncbi:MAG: hypothetical protein IPP19_10790 [Verrucomicrobia bacterium]|nr:hypothetical protein [Verrucomicrobiota bacterium]
MKKAILSILLSLSVVASVQAVSYSDNNPANVWLNVLNPSYTGEFTLAGYNPTTETITTASAVFTFADLIGSESFVVNLTGDVLSQGSFFGVLALPTNILNGLITLDSTGALSYTVSRKTGEFWLTHASLTAESTARRNVPDAAATALLLGLGVIGMVAAKRRFGSAA